MATLGFTQAIHIASTTVTQAFEYQRFASIPIIWQGPPPLGANPSVLEVEVDLILTSVFGGDALLADPLLHVHQFLVEYAPGPKVFDTATPAPFTGEAVYSTGRGAFDLSSHTVFHAAFSAQADSSIDFASEIIFSLNLYAKAPDNEPGQVRDYVHSIEACGRVKIAINAVSQPKGNEFSRVEFYKMVLVR